jgi:hypothetical protein
MNETTDNCDTKNERKTEDFSDGMTVPTETPD